MTFSAVYIVSFSALCFEILLARVFSISQWNHLSFMVISIALFGFAAAGTFLSLIDLKMQNRRKGPLSTGWIKTILILFVIAEITSFILLNQIPFDYFKLPVDPLQALYLASIYLSLSLPFFFAGLIISASYARLPHKSGTIYGANMVGSACGALFPIFFLPIFGEEKTIILTALLPLVLVLFWRGKPSKSQNEKPIKIPVILSSLLIILIAFWLMLYREGSLVKIPFSQYKTLSQVLQYPETRIVETSTSLEGKIDTVQSPYIRFAPGLSIKYSKTMHCRHAIFKDGDNPFYLYDFSGKESIRFSRFTLQFSGYLLSPNPEQVLLIQQGGGSGIPCAISSNARNITIVQPNYRIADAVGKHYNLPVTCQNPRAFLARSNERFNIIHVENWGNALPGSEALNQNGMFTRESFKSYLEHLTQDGIIIIARRLLLPPSDSLRLVAGAYEALLSSGIENPGDHFVILRNWSAFTLIISAQPLHHMTIIKDFARNNNFDMVYFTGITENEANRFNVFDKPYHFMEISRLIKAYESNRKNNYFQDHLLDIAPQSDSRPFHTKFLKWSHLKKIYASTGSRIYSLFMSGEAIVPVVFLEALIISIILLLLPLFKMAGKGDKLSWQAVFYFLSIGAGYILVELYFIKVYTILFNDPVISLSLVLTGILIFSGAGGYIAQISDMKNPCVLLAGLSGVLLFLFIGFDAIVQKMLGFTDQGKACAAFFILLPAGLLMGPPLPLGIRHLLNSPVQRAYAWSINGCASILAAVASAHIALNAGIPTIIICAATAYGIALAASLRR